MHQARSRLMLSWGPSRGQPDKGDLSTWGFAAPLSDPAVYESSRPGQPWQQQQLHQQQQQHEQQLQEPRKRGNVRWGSAQQQLEAPAEEEEDILLEQEQSSRRATGRSKRGSFFPHATAAGHARPGTAFMGTPNRGGTASTRQAEPNLRGGSHSAASLAFGYQPYSLKDYRENRYDPKSFQYWMLGKLGPGPVSRELQVMPGTMQCLYPVSA